MVSPSEFDTKRLVSDLTDALVLNRHSHRSIAGWREHAAWMFHRCGQTWHELLLLNEIMCDFKSSGVLPDPVLAYEEISNDLAQGASPQSMARRCYELALALAPKHAETIYNLAMLEGRFGDVDGTLEKFQKVTELAPARGAPGHARTIDNALWNCGEILERKGRLQQAADRYRVALAGLGSIGPHQRRYPRLLQKLMQLDKAATEFDAVMTYSHRYAPEFIPPARGADLMPPRDAQQRPVDPFRISRLGRLGTGHQLVYFAGVYFRWPMDAPVPDSGTGLLAWVRESGPPPRRFVLFGRSEPICAPQAGYWGAAT